MNGSKTICKSSVRTACVVLILLYSVCLPFLTSCSKTSEEKTAPKYAERRQIYKDKHTRQANVKGYTFESQEVPENWIADSSGRLSVSGRHYKHGSKSLQWDWQKNSRITVKNLETTNNSQDVRGIRAWVYNENPVAGQLTFRFGTGQELKEGNPHYEFKFGLDYNGWRAMWVDLKNDVGTGNYEGNGPLAVMTITAPAEVESGTLFFDIVEFQDITGVTTTGWRRRSNDCQVPFVHKKARGHWQNTYRFSRARPEISAAKTVTQEQSDAFKKIAERYSDWLLGKNVNMDDELVQLKYQVLQKYIKDGINAFSELNIKRDGDNITGTPMFASPSPYGPKFSRHIIAECVLPLALDYKINGNNPSKEKFMDLLDHMNDQGWAAGSANGSLDHELNRSSSYFQAVFLMKDELEETGRLQRELAAMRWYTELGEIYIEPEHPGTTADRVISHLPYRLLAVLAMPDTPEKVRDMRYLTDSMNNDFSITPGWEGLIKPDYLGFHHKGHYGSAYAAPAFHYAAFICYLLNDTAFALSRQAHGNIKQALLTNRVFANKYDVPVGVSGRMPFSPPVLVRHMPGYAYMAMAGDPIDEQMAAVFMRLWDPGQALVEKHLITSLLERDAYIHTPGSLQIMQQLAQKNIKPELSPAGNWAKNYGALSIHRRDNWMVSVRGCSKYVWDFESESGQNVYGRYQGRAAMQIFCKGEPVTGSDSGYVEQGWDWARWPGTTTVKLPLGRLAEKKSYQLYFTDEPFVGGLSHKGRNGIFVMNYHDTTFDTSFRAKKSVFFFDDTIVCLGSDIENDDQLHDTETTLFQGHLKEDSNPIWVNSLRAVKTLGYEKQLVTEKPAWLMDAYGNGYYVPEGRGINIHRKIQQSMDNAGKKQTSAAFATAWLDHGKAPDGASYEYAVLVQSTPEKVSKFAEKPRYEVLQKDSLAHIVKHSGLNSTGYVLFEENHRIKHGMLESASRACLVMITEKGNKLELSVCSPDLKLTEKPIRKASDITSDMVYNESGGARIVLVLEGLWDLDYTVPHADRSGYYENSTEVNFWLRDGMTIDISLSKLD